MQPAAVSHAEVHVGLCLLPPARAAGSSLPSWTDVWVLSQPRGQSIGESDSQNTKKWWDRGPPPRPCQPPSCGNRAEFGSHRAVWLPGNTTRKVQNSKSSQTHGAEPWAGAGGPVPPPPSTVRRIRITILPVGTNHVGEMQGLLSVTNACHVRHDHPGNMNLGAQEKARSDGRLSLLSWTVKKRNKNVSVDLGEHSLIWQGGKPLADCDSKKATALGEARDTDFQVSAT